MVSPALFITQVTGLVTAQTLQKMGSQLPFHNDEGDDYRDRVV